MPLGLAGGLAPLVLTAYGVALTVIWVGVPILMVVTMLWRGVARMERAWMRLTLGVDIPTPLPAAAGGLGVPPLAGHRLHRAAAAAVHRGVRAGRGFWLNSLALVLLPLWAPLLPANNSVNLLDVHFHPVPCAPPIRPCPMPGSVW